MHSHTCHPILLLVFNRPDLTERVFARIREAKPQQLFIAADGARRDRPGEDGLCAQTRRATESIDWDCEVHRLYRDENLGCKIAVSGAISWFFENVESGIILEDDCLPVDSFFRFCGELLERYRYNDEIGVISGTNPFCPAPRLPQSYYFSKYAHIWGWATWRRVWDKYEVGIPSWSGQPADLRGVIPKSRVRNFWAALFDQVKDGKIDTWDYQLLHLCMSSHLKSVTSVVCLVENIGFDARATHTPSRSADKKAPFIREMDFPLIHPVNMKINEMLDARDEKDSWGLEADSLNARARTIEHRFRVAGGTLLRALGIKKPPAVPEADRT